MTIGTKVKSLWDGRQGVITCGARLNSDRTPDTEHFLRIMGGECHVKWNDGTRTKEVWIADIQAI